jgi:hypothetical protein
MFPRDQSIPNQVRRIAVILDQPQAPSGNRSLGRQLGQQRQGLAIIQQSSGCFGLGTAHVRGQLHFAQLL